MPQALFRGPIPGISPWLMPVAHGLEHAREELRESVPGLDADALWKKPAGAASVGWHLLHIAGSTDRLFTYAHGESLDDRQRQWLDLEKAGHADLDGGQIMATIEQVFDRCLEVLSQLDDAELQAAREVGGAKLPSTMFGLLFHAAEHAQRHSGQILTTAKILAGRNVGG